MTPSTPARKIASPVIGAALAGVCFTLGLREIMEGSLASGIVGLLIAAVCIFGSVQEVRQLTQGSR